ncbi:MAG: hypothetical protein A2087_03635 [Spirochaetes bacterium GWD1_61_31]|nr:MAG: hypothetical protein A2Y37_01010 [Spirochaetes bacterium GWB1_60_80]OHD30985.1 MAG: hypothetical protein A2004_06820 [Spirochaetes bacterium GWC1_61_12]OHD36183.1 MAG: hypothetical protein A2087_03635 [Spirochaetes bacterium GWD1_61_31]OHD43247.1 MAG: hypothetical protein A2Y35_08455 [Spirochaetes bacterium GWE1_60_18]OHD58807.1 MAG: hypothetical protein A2Y32_01290 [Spirochaetes bacterium GWF1_60_12]
MKILHSSDWHLGRLLYGRRRLAEQEAFLEWLLALMRDEAIEALLLAGDIFDTTTPGNQALEAYYSFLKRAIDGGCRHIVVTAGNHDSPSTLAAPRQVLRTLGVHVVVDADDPAAAVLCLRDSAGRPELVVCAVPYLRDRDLRAAEAGETFTDKEQRLLEGLRARYAAIHGLAKLTIDAQPGLAAISMGHLFAAGGATVADDGVRELYIGGLAQVGADLFPDWLAYTALGHLHIAQTVGGRPEVRYAGSPLAMGFNEAGQSKQVVIIEVDTLATVAGDHSDATATTAASARRPVRIQPVNIPVFQKLRRLSGSLAELEAALTSLKADATQSDAAVWLELECVERASPSAIKERLYAALEGSPHQILIIKHAAAGESGGGLAVGPSLAAMSETEVFERLLEAEGVPEANRAELRLCYGQLLRRLYETESAEAAAKEAAAKEAGA